MATNIRAARAGLLTTAAGVLGALGALGALAVTGTAHAQSSSPRLYNTVIEKLKAGQQVVGGTVLTGDPEIYCAMANAGYDFLWIEMQHSPLTYQEVARMIWACRGAPAIPFIRVPDATPGDIQKATDIGALGIIVPLVETVEEARDTVKYAMYPPEGLRSLGNGQYRALWGDDYRATANENIMIVAMIESPAGVAIADAVAAVPGVDVVFAASTDLGSFSGLTQGDPLYEQMVTDIAAATLAAGRYLGGPQAWMNRPGFAFFQGPPETALLRLGVQESLRTAPRGVAPTEGGRD
jgi:2-keto-3-deoxy-L-rhamnonate aldolase RhmA